MVTKPISMINAIGNEEGTYRAGVTSEGRLMVDSGGGGGGDVNLVEVGGNAVAKTTNNIDNIALSGVAGFQEVISLTALYDSANTVWARWYGNTAGGYVQGNIASGASDSGNPLKVGGRYNSTPPTLTNGQRGDLQLDASGNAKVAAQATQNNIGNVGGKTVSVTVAPTVAASNAYGANYVVGGLLTFANAFTSTGSGILQTVTVTIAKVETVSFSLYLFNANPSNTTWTDAAVAAINAADVAKVRPPVLLSYASQLGTHTVAYAAGIGEAMNVGATTLYGVLIVGGALTNQFGSTSDVTVTVTILQDV